MLNRLSLGDSQPKRLQPIPEVYRYVELFLSLSDGIREECYLQGNILWNMLLPNSARVTKDLDLTVINEKLYSDVIVPRLTLFGDWCLDRYDATSYRLNNMIVGRSSGGIKVYKGQRVLFAVDIAVPSDSFIISDRYLIEDVEIYGSSFEQIVSDKVLATIQPNRFRRLKDFYDLYIIHKERVPVNFQVVRSILLHQIALEELETKLLDTALCLQDIDAFSRVWKGFRAYSFLQSGAQEDLKPSCVDLLSGLNIIYEHVSYGR